MKKYRCTICGYIYDEKKEKIKFEDLPEDWTCPMCGAPKYLFEEIKEDEEEKKEWNTVEDYLKEYERASDEKEKDMSDIHEMAKTGKSIISAMGTLKKVLSWDDILILGNHLNTALYLPLH